MKTKPAAGEVRKICVPGVKSPDEAIVEVSRGDDGMFTAAYHWTFAGVTRNQVLPNSFELERYAVRTAALVMLGSLKVFVPAGDAGLKNVCKSIRDFINHNPATRAGGGVA
jgi:hypothetical protein